MKQHFVTFCSPGTFCAETSQRPIDSWDINEARMIVKGIKERHGATPYGFYFSTRGRRDGDLDSKVIATSPMYYLGGKIETLVEVKLRNDPKEETLRWNMEHNGYNRIITNTNSYKSVFPLKDDDIVLQWA